MLGYSVFNSEELYVHIDTDDVDAARAAGVPIDVETDDEWRSNFFLLTDRVFAADLVRRGVEGLEARGRKPGEGSRAGGRAGEDAPIDPTDTDAVAEQRRKEREQKEKERNRAENHNHKLGKALLARRGAGSRKRHSLARAKVLAQAVVAAEPQLAARGLRYVLPQLRDIEVRELKSGEQRSKPVLADEQTCREYLERKISEAKTPHEVLELMADAMVAA